MNLFEYRIDTARSGFYEITAKVAEAVRQSGIRDGLAYVFCPHTTAGITINENADPDVVHDLMVGLDAAFPDNPRFMHSEGNSPAHLKATAVGSGVTLIVENGSPILGSWQGVYFCEFDGPRRRRFYVKVV